MWCADRGGQGVDLYTFGWALAPSPNPDFAPPPNDASAPNLFTSWSAPKMQNLVFGFSDLTRTQFSGY